VCTKIEKNRQCAARREGELVVVENEARSSPEELDDRSARRRFAMCGIDRDSSEGEGE
jgi:hypothetical protein